MSYEEQKAVMAPVIQELKDEREVKVLAKRNVPLSAFHDIKKTLEGIENQASLLISPILGRFTSVGDPQVCAGHLLKITRRSPTRGSRSSCSHGLWRIQV